MAFRSKKLKEKLNLRVMFWKCKLNYDLYKLRLSFEFDLNVILKITMSFYLKNSIEQWFFR